MTLKDFCKKHGLTEAQATGKEKICGDLDLSSVTSIPEGFNPTVGGYLDLSSVIDILVPWLNCPSSLRAIYGEIKSISKSTASSLRLSRSEAML